MCQTAFEEARVLALAEVRQTFRPELLNRLDETVVFQALSNTNLKAVGEARFLSFLPAFPLCFSAAATSSARVDGEARVFAVTLLRRL